MSACFRQQQEIEEYEQWLADPVAQAEYKRYLDDKEKRKCNSKTQEVEILNNHQSERMSRAA
jgi:hypothetical protein